MEEVFNICASNYDVRSKVDTERIQPGQVASITDDQLFQMGLTTIGERIKFRDASRDVAADCPVRTTSAIIRSRRRVRAAHPQPGSACKKSKISWTANLYCLQKNNTHNLCMTPAYRRALIRYKLGPKKFKINDASQMTISEFHYGILSLYPALSAVGGFDICLAGNSGCHDLEKLEYIDLSVVEIRQIVCQSKMYIRPAKDIETGNNSMPSAEERPPISSSNEERLTVSRQSSSSDGRPPIDQVIAARILRQHSLCSNGHTLVSADSLCLICVQDREYQATLEIDRERAEIRRQLHVEESAPTRNVNVQEQLEETRLQRNLYFSTQNGVQVVRRRRQVSVDVIAQQSTSMEGRSSTTNVMVQTGRSDAQHSSANVITSTDLNALHDLDILYQRQEEPVSNDICRQVSDVEAGAYASYVALLSESSEDEDVNVQRALHDSFSDSVQLESLSTEGYKDLLKDVSSQVLSDEQRENTLLVQRSRLLASAVAAMHRTRFNSSKQLTVEFAGEDAEDFGGPRREFFCLAVKAMISNSGVFEGPTNSVVFSHSARLHESNAYFDMGRLLAMALTQGGPGMYSMSLATYQYWSHQTVNPLTLTTELIADIGMRNKVEQINNAADSDAFGLAVEPLVSWAIDNGIEDIETIQFANKGSLVHRIVRQLVLYRTSVSAVEFAKGFDSVLNLHKLVIANAAKFQALFTHDAIRSSLTRRTFKALCRYEHSVEGSNKRKNEDETIYAWEMMLQCVEDGESTLTFAGLLQFITGSDRVPPLGFDKLIIVDFYEMTDSNHYPQASTCDLHIWLPRGVDVPTLKRLLEDGVTCCHGFGKI